MTGPDSGRLRGEAHSVTDPRLAALLTDPLARRYYEPFVARTLSVKAAADEAHCTLDAMLYRVRVFVKAGLLRVVGQQRRKGRAIKLYRTAYDAYFVPHQVTPFATLEERFYKTTEPFVRQWARLSAVRLRARGVEGVRLYRDRYGEFWAESAASVTSLGGLDVQNLADPARPAAFDIMSTLYLDEAGARDLQRALAALFEAWRGKPRPESVKTFQLGIFFYPDPP